jgi:hypothetical protein
MGLLKKKNAGPLLRRLPTGTFTVDAQGQVIGSTVPQAVPAAIVRDIGREVVAIFEEARRAQLPFSEMVAQYAAFKITARAMRGGAIIFLSSKAPQLASSA